MVATSTLTGSCSLGTRRDVGRRGGPEGHDELLKDDHDICILMMQQSKTRIPLFAIPHDGSSCHLVIESVCLPLDGNLAVWCWIQWGRSRTLVGAGNLVTGNRFLFF